MSFEPQSRPTDVVNFLDLENYDGGIKKLLSDNFLTRTESQQFTERFGDMEAYVDTTLIPQLTVLDNHEHTNELTWESDTHSLSAYPTVSTYATLTRNIRFDEYVKGLKMTFSRGSVMSAHVKVISNRDGKIYLDQDCGEDTEVFIPEILNNESILFSIAGTVNAGDRIGTITLEGCRQNQVISTVEDYVKLTKRDTKEEISYEYPAQVVYKDTSYNTASYEVGNELVYVRTGNQVTLFGSVEKTAGSSAAFFTSVPSDFIPARQYDFYPCIYDYSTQTTTWHNPIHVDEYGNIWMTNNNYGHSVLDGFTYVVRPYSEYVGGGVACYAPDTIIYGEENKKISELEIGDKVYSYNHREDHYELDEVKNIIEHKDIKKVVKITVGDDVITCTPEHKLFTVESAYCYASNLKPGYSIFNSDQELKEIDDVEIVEEEIVGYDIDTNNHNYFVGNNKLLTQTEYVTSLKQPIEE